MKVLQEPISCYLYTFPPKADGEKGGPPGKLLLVGALLLLLVFSLHAVKTAEISKLRGDGALLSVPHPSAAAGAQGGLPAAIPSFLPCSFISSALQG